MAAKKNVIHIKESPFAAKHSFVILSAGVGSRIKSFGNRSLFKIGEETVLSRQVRIIRDNFKHAEIILIAGFEAERLMNKAPADIIKIENEKYEEDNVARSISIGIRACTTERVFLMYGDLVFSQNLFSHHQTGSYLVVDKSGLMDNASIGCNIHNNVAEHLMFDLPNKWAQVGFFTGKELKCLKMAAWNKDNYKMFGFELINQVIEKSGGIPCVQDQNIKIFDIDSNKDLEKISKI